MENNLGTIISSYKGFNVKIKTYLYQLIWDDEISSYFYKDFIQKTAKKEMRTMTALINKCIYNQYKDYPID